MEGEPPAATQPDATPLQDEAAAHGAEEVLGAASKAFGLDSDAWVLLLGLLTALLVVGTTYFWIKASDKKASELGEAPWLDGLSTEVPEGKKETFEKAYDEPTAEKLRDSAASTERLADEAAEQRELREHLCGLLRARTEAFVVAWLAAVREMRTVARAAQRRLASDADYDAAVGDFDLFKEERAAIFAAANELRPGFPGWGAAIFQEAYDELVRGHPSVPTEEAVATVPREGQLGMESVLRFRRGARVECNMGEHGYVAGTVTEAWELPYHVVLDDASHITAPVDVDHYIRATTAPELATTPSDISLALWIPRDDPARFVVRQQVMAKCSEVYRRGVIVAVRPNINTRDGKVQRVAYAIRIEPTAPGERSRVVNAPIDLDACVRRCTEEEAAKPALEEEEPPPQPPPPLLDGPLRFTVGATVMANMGSNGFVRAIVGALKPELKQQDGSVVVKAYQLQLEQIHYGQPGPVVFAPADNDNTVRLCTAEEFAAAPAVTRLALRFSIGDTVLASMGKEVGFLPGRVIGLRPRTVNKHVQEKTGKQGPPVIAAYELELETKEGEPRRTVFAPVDTDDCVKRRVGQPEKNKPEKKAGGRRK